jgi:hypothetical protein
MAHFSRLLSHRTGGISVCFFIRPGPPPYLLENVTDWALQVEPFTQQVEEAGPPAIERHSVIAHQIEPQRTVVAPHSVLHIYSDPSPLLQARVRLWPDGNWSEPINMTRVR